MIGVCTYEERVQFIAAALRATEAEAIAACREAAFNAMRHGTFNQAVIQAIEGVASSPAAASPFNHPWRSYVTWVDGVERVLREARQYVSDAEDDEDPETRDHASSLLGDIDMALNLTPTPPDETGGASPWREIAAIADVVFAELSAAGFRLPDEAIIPLRYGLRKATGDVPSPPASERMKPPVTDHCFDSGSFGGGDQGECALCGRDAKEHMRLPAPSPGRAEPQEPQS